MKNKWHWMFFKKENIMADLMIYLNEHNVDDFYFVGENENYKFYMIKINSLQNKRGE